MKAKAIFFSIVFSLICCVGSMAQPGGGGDPGGGEPVPFSGLEILLVGGAYLGIRSMKSARKQTKE